MSAARKAAAPAVEKATGPDLSAATAWLAERDRLADRLERAGQRVQDAQTRHAETVGALENSPDDPAAFQRLTDQAGAARGTVEAAQAVRRGAERDMAAHMAGLPGVIGVAARSRAAWAAEQVARIERTYQALAAEMLDLFAEGTALVVALGTGHVAGVSLGGTGLLALPDATLPRTLRLPVCGEADVYRVGTLIGQVQPRHTVASDTATASRQTLMDLLGAADRAGVPVQASGVPRARTVHQAEPAAALPAYQVVPVISFAEPSEPSKPAAPEPYRPATVIRFGDGYDDGRPVRPDDAAPANPGTRPAPKPPGGVDPTLIMVSKGIC